MLDRFDHLRPQSLPWGRKMSTPRLHGWPVGLARAMSAAGPLRWWLQAQIRHDYGVEALQASVSRRPDPAGRRRAPDSVGAAAPVGGSAARHPSASIGRPRRGAWRCEPPTSVRRSRQWRCWRVCGGGSKRISLVRARIRHSSLSIGKWPGLLRARVLRVTGLAGSTVRSTVFQCPSRIITRCAACPCRPGLRPRSFHGKTARPSRPCARGALCCSERRTRPSGVCLPSGTMPTTSCRATPTAEGEPRAARRPVVPWRLHSG